MDESPAQSRDEERSRTLLEINNALVLNLTRETLFQAIARALRRVLPFDRTAIFLHDPDRDVLRLFILESSLTSRYFGVGLEMAPGDSHVGWVFTHRQPLLRRDLTREARYLVEEWALADGVRSYVMVPLLARGDCIGVLAAASTNPGQYSPADVSVLQDVANQVALAVENMKAYEANARLYEEMKLEAAQRRRAEERLHAVTAGTASATGVDFFRSLVLHLAGALQVRYAFVAECDTVPDRARTLAFWTGTGFGENFEYDTTPTPCREVLAGQVCRHERDVQALFPKDRDLVDLGAESYLGVPIVGAGGRVIGHLAVLDVRAMPEDPQAVSVLQIFAARAGAEMERLAAEARVQTALSQVEALRSRLQDENVYLQEEIRRVHNVTEMVGSSPPLMEVLRKVDLVAPTDSTVLLVGETGTGKELIARALHSRSLRRSRPLVKVNCGAIAAGLVESELFGHVKGAFTGALEARVGRFALADHGTLFLDEVSELPLETQVKLLRVLQEGEFEPVGSSRTVTVDVRIVAATNRDLDEAVRAGRFRADLLYRLDVVRLAIPPLRERRQDIPQLVMFFLDRLSKRLGKRLDRVSPGAMARLQEYGWPGNVRELQNIVERAAVLAPGPVLELDDDLLPPAARDLARRHGAPGGRAVRESSTTLREPTAGAGASASPGANAGAGAAPPPEPTAETGTARTGPPSTLEEMERAHVLSVLRETGWVIEGPRGAARVLGLHPNTLRSRMERLGIRRPSHGAS